MAIEKLIVLKRHVHSYRGVILAQGEILRQRREQLVVRRTVAQ